MSIWISLKDAQPATSVDPSRSISVLVCNCKTGTYTSLDDGTLYNSYDAWIMSAYYDSDKKRWYNDHYGERADRIKATHWMPLPAIDSPEWTAIVQRTPGIEGEDEDMSPYVLICDRNSDYESSIIAAQKDLDDGSWHAMLDVLTDDDFLNGEVKATHWFPLPDPPYGF